MAYKIEELKDRDGAQFFIDCLFVFEGHIYRFWQLDEAFGCTIGYLHDIDPKICSESKIIGNYKDHGYMLVCD